MFTKKYCTIILFLLFHNFILSQNVNTVSYISFDQNFKSDFSPGLNIGVISSIKISNSISLDLGINTTNHINQKNIIDNNVNDVQILQQNVDKVEFLSKLELRYYSLPVGISFNSRSNWKFGLGVQYMRLVNQKYINIVKFFNDANQIIETENYPNNERNYSSFILESYLYINKVIWKNIGVQLKLNRSIVNLSYNTGNRAKQRSTERISFGISYLICH